MVYFNFNGKILPQSTAILGPDNRGMRYGDGLFETIKFKHKELILFDEHLARLWKGMQLLQFQLPKLFTPDRLQKETLALLNKNKLEAARVRITVIRGDGGLYDAINHSPEYIIQCWPLAEQTGLLNENGLQLCFFRDAKKSTDIFSNLKHNNFLPYLLGALHAKQQFCNDAVILNCLGRVADSSIANIFMVKDGIVYTSALEEGCIAGVIRKFIIQVLPTLGYPVKETAITENDLLAADEVFLTNSIYDIRWVAGIQNKTYGNRSISKLYELLRQTNGNVFC